MRGPASLRSMLIGVSSLDLKSALPYFMPWSRAKAGQQLGIRLGTETRHIGDRHPAVLDRHARCVGHMAEIAEEAFERDLFLFGGEDMQRREITGPKVRRMWHARRAILL